MSAEALAQQQVAAGQRRPAGAGGPQRLPGPQGEKYVRTRLAAPHHAPRDRLAV